MRISPISPALWCAGMIAMFMQLLDLLLLTNFMDPIVTLVFFFFTHELSKFVAEMTMRDDDGTDSN